MRINITSKQYKHIYIYHPNSAAKQSIKNPSNSQTRKKNEGFRKYLSPRHRRLLGTYHKSTKKQSNSKITKPRKTEFLQINSNIKRFLFFLPQIAISILAPSLEVDIHSRLTISCRSGLETHHIWATRREATTKSATVYVDWLSKWTQSTLLSYLPAKSLEKPLDRTKTQRFKTRVSNQIWGFRNKSTPNQQQTHFKHNRVDSSSKQTNLTLGFLNRKRNRIDFEIFEWNRDF